MIGTQLLHYQIESLLGSGGMGEVYRAIDTRLGRSVAIKVLPALFAQDSERVARFEREARLLAALNHPNIAALHGVEAVDGRRLLVMELVEGETLSERIARGPVPVEEALGLARQICEALEAAHEKGVIHRDLKPANVKLTRDGKVKVLDFGLARAAEAAAPGATAMNSPTISIAATNAGVILGTAAYMSPEQAKGIAIDHRSDIFSFGCVLYEMLTGRQSFQGDTMTEVIASVLKTEPDVTMLPPRLHPRIVDVVRRCLVKDPKRRWHAIADVRVEIESILADPRGLTPAIPSGVDARPLWRRALPLGVAAILGALLAGGAAWVLRPAEDTVVSRFAIVLPAEQRLTRLGRPNITVSPDGRNIVYVADGQLYVRGIGDIEPRPIPGTNQDVNSPVFSPDGQWIAFYVVGEAKLKRIPVTGGAAVTVADFSNPYGASWGADDRILLGAGEQGIARVSANGGTPETVIKVDSGQYAHGPQMLPDGDHVLFTLAASTNTARWDEAQIVVQSLSTGERKVVFKGGSDARYVPTGHIVYALGANLMAVPFDTGTLEAGGPVAILEGVMRASAVNTGAAFMAFSETGSLVYFFGDSGLGAARTLAVVDGKGTATPLPFAPDQFVDPRLSPDGRQLLVRVDDDSSAQTLWIYDMAGIVAPRRLTFAGNSVSPIWMPDGRRVLYLSSGDASRGIVSQAADGGGAPEALATTEPIQPLGDLVVSPDGETLIYRDARGPDIWMVPMSGERKPRLLIGGTSGQFQASFSPDGKWIAYGSAEGTAPNIYVQPFPPTGAKYQISSVSSRAPLWSRDGKQLLYIEALGGDIGRLVVVDVQTASGFGVVGKPRPLFDAVHRLGGAWPFAVMDGGRLLVVVAGDTGDQARAPEIRVTLNWFEDLKQRVPID